MSAIASDCYRTILAREDGVRKAIVKAPVRSFRLGCKIPLIKAVVGEADASAAQNSALWRRISG